MALIDVLEGKKNLSKLLTRAAAGEEIIISKDGKPVARLVPHQESPSPKRKPGSMRAKVKILPGFKEVDKEIEASFQVPDKEKREARLDNRESAGPEQVHAELKQAETLVLRFGEVDAKSLHEKITSAHLLAVCDVKGSVAGVAAVKRLDRHHETVKRVSGYSKLDDYSGEFGYVAVSKQHRRIGIGTRICKKLLDEFKKPVYATVRDTNEDMHGLLTKLGFIKHGTPWPSPRRRAKIELWVQHTLPTHLTQRT